MAMQARPKRKVAAPARAKASTSDSLGPHADTVHDQHDLTPTGFRRVAAAAAPFDTAIGSRSRSALAAVTTRSVSTKHAAPQAVTLATASLTEEDDDGLAIAFGAAFAPAADVSRHVLDDIDVPAPLPACLRESDMRAAIDREELSPRKAETYCMAPSEATRSMHVFAPVDEVVLGFNDAFAKEGITARFDFGECEFACCHREGAGVLRFRAVVLLYDDKVNHHRVDMTPTQRAGPAAFKFARILEAIPLHLQQRKLNVVPECELKWKALFASAVPACQAGFSTAARSPCAWLGGVGGAVGGTDVDILRCLSSHDAADGRVDELAAQSLRRRRSRAVHVAHVEMPGAVLPPTSRTHSLDSTATLHQSRSSSLASNVSLATSTFALAMSGIDSAEGGLLFSSQDSLSCDMGAVAGLDTLTDFDDDDDEDGGFTGDDGAAAAKDQDADDLDSWSPIVAMLTSSSPTAVTHGARAAADCALRKHLHPGMVAAGLPRAVCVLVAASAQQEEEDAASSTRSVASSRSAAAAQLVLQSLCAQFLSAMCRSAVGQQRVRELLTTHATAATVALQRWSAVTEPQGTRPAEHTALVHRQRASATALQAALATHQPTLEELMERARPDGVVAGVGDGGIESYLEGGIGGQ